MQPLHGALAALVVVLGAWSWPVRGDVPGLIAAAARQQPASAAEVRTAEAAYAEGQRLRAEWWVGDAAQRAAELYDAAAASWKKAGDVRGEARASHGRCILSISLTDYQDALQTCTRVLEIARSSGDRGREAGVLFSLSTILNRTGDIPAMLAYARQALPLMRAESDRSNEAAVLVRIGQGLSSESSQRDLLSARDHLEQALRLYRTLADPAGTALSLTLLGELDDEQGNRAAGLARHREALAVAEAAGDEQREGVVLVNLGENRAARKEYAEAQEALTRAIAIFRRRGDRARLPAPLYSLADVDQRQGLLTAARAHVEEAIELVETLRRSVSADDLRASVQGRRRYYYGLAIDILTRLHRTDSAAGYDRQAFEVSERARARSLLDLLTEGRVEIQRDLPPALKTRERDVEERLSSVQRRLLAARGGRATMGQLASLERELQAAEEARRALEWEIQGRYRDYAAIAYPSPLTLERVVSLLDRRTALLEYVLDRSGSFLFVVTSEGLTTYRLTDVEHLDRLVAEARQALATPGRRELTQYRRAARQLYQAIVAPAARVLSTRQALIVVPDRSLHYLPFEILLTADSAADAGDPASLPYLLRRWSVSYVPSASVLATLHERAAPREREFPRSPTLVAIAAPSVTSGAPSFKPLPYVRQEIASIARMFKPDEVTVLVDEQAREEHIKGDTTLERARYLHFATHGVVDERQPAHAGLVLSSGTASTEDGVLRVYEIYNSRFAADLVVLSACHTALGRNVGGEGLMGLSRAFLYAGARSLVVSLWQVTDQSTPSLMAAFYGGLPRAGKAEALRQAKLATIKADTWAHPYYWAPFVLQGDAR